MTTIGTTSVEEILPGFRRTGNRNYVGRHHLPTAAPLATRAADALRKPGNLAASLGERLGHKLADSLSDEQAERAYDFLTGQTFHDVSDRIAHTWRTLDRAAYGRIPKTWRHRLETRAAARRELDRQQRDTEAWWAGRVSDYAPALGIHTPTQPLHVIEEKTNA